MLVYPTDHARGARADQELRLITFIPGAYSISYGRNRV